MTTPAKRDPNFVPAMQGVSSVDSLSPTDVHVDPTDNHTLVKGKIWDGTNTADVVSEEGIKSLRTVTGTNDDFHISLSKEAVAVTTGYVLVDLSDTTNFPHTNTDHVLITWIDISINPDTSFAGDVCIGYLTNIDGTDATINILKEFHLDRSASSINQFSEYNSSHFSAEPAQSLLDFTAEVTQFNTGVSNMPRPGNGTTTPADGDIVLLVTRTGGSIDVGVSMGYRTSA